MNVVTVGPDGLRTTEAACEPAHVRQVHHQALALGMLGHHGPVTNYITDLARCACMPRAGFVGAMPWEAAFDQATGAPS